MALQSDTLADKKRKRINSESGPPSPQPPTAQRRPSLSATDPLVNPYSTQLERSASKPTIVVHDPDATVSMEPISDAPELPLEPEIARPPLMEEWSSMSQDSSDQERTTGSTTRSGSPVDGVLMPETIDYTLKITFEKTEVPIKENEGSIRLNDVSDYQKFEKFSENCVREHCISTLAGRSLHFRNGDCTILGDHNYSESHGLSSHEDWKDIHTILVNHWGSHRYRHQHLYIFRDYFGLLTRKKTDETFAKSKQMEIYRLMKEGLDDRKYIPRTDLIRITSADMIREILREDPVQGITQPEQDAFYHQILQEARKLLAVCVYTQLRMECLKYFLDMGHNDNTLSSKPLENRDCCHDGCGPKFENLLQMQGGFYAAEFGKVGDHRKLHRRTVIPIQYHPRKADDNRKADDEDVPGERRDTSSESEASMLDNEEMTARQREAYCGSGAFSKVYRVRLDPEHLRFTKNKNADFAIKIFNDRPQRTEADFKKELMVLDELLQHRNDHIVTHLASWTQDGRYYMLFSYAQCNLRHYMKSMTLGKPNKENVLWLLRQFLGLSTALKQIHDLTKTETAPVISESLLPPAQGLRKSGWHHDLKPENILYFKVLSTYRGEFQIADFGSSKVHTYRSGSINTRSATGTQTYEPPDQAKYGVTSRPYDVWSMGCIFLELLVWATFGCASVKTFRSNRDQKRFPDSRTDTSEDDSFWYMDGTGTIALRQSVSDWIQNLRDELRRRRLDHFEQVLELIVRMLDIEKRTRIPALDLWDTLVRIHEQATIDMKKLKRDALPGEADLKPKSSTLLPRLSTHAPDRHTPEPVSPAITSRSDVSQRPELFLGGDLTTSPGVTSSTRGQRSNSAMSNFTISSRPRGLSDSSTYVQGGSSPAHTPETAHEEG